MDTTTSPPRCEKCGGPRKPGRVRFCGRRCSLGLPPAPPQPPAPPPPVLQPPKPPVEPARVPLRSRVDRPWHPRVDQPAPPADDGPGPLVRLTVTEGRHVAYSGVVRLRTADRLRERWAQLRPDLTVAITEHREAV